MLRKADYLAQIADQQPHLQALGFQFANTVPVAEMPLGHHYTRVQTHGVMRVETRPGQAIDLVHDAVYIQYITDDGPKLGYGNDS